MAGTSAHSPPTPIPPPEPFSLHRPAPTAGLILEILRAALSVLETRRAEIGARPLQNGSWGAHDLQNGMAAARFVGGERAMGQSTPVAPFRPLRHVR